MEKKILVAFDNSENSLKSIEMIGETFTKDHKITLLSIIPDISAVCSLDGKELSPHFRAEQNVYCAMEEQHRDIMKEAQEKAREMLIEKGFIGENILLKIETVRHGVARDIVSEAESGYSTIVMGRRGISGIKEFFLGSVSHKVINASKGVSILVVE